MNDPLKFVSNVIELKPGHKYLLILKGPVNRGALDSAQALLRSRGIDCISFSLGEHDDMDVIEVPEVKEDGSN